jgi:hypothetical protein
MLTSWTKLTRVKIGLLTAAACTTALCVGAGTASADTEDVVCTFGSSSGNVETCVSVIHSGLFVDEVTVSACVQDSTRTLQLCIHGPDPDLPICSPFEVVSRGNCIFESWFPDRDVPGGEYCARTWRANAGASPTLIGQPCVDVHR